MHTQLGIYFHVCCQASEGNCDLYAHSAKSWEFHWYVQPRTWNWLKMTKGVQRKTSGYDTQSYDKVATNYIHGWVSSATATGPLPDQCPVLTNFTSAEQNRGVIQVAIYDSQIMVVTELGIMPQLWDLFGKVGGYLALLTLIFHTCFVKKYPESGVAQVYEARTFIGDRIPIIGSPSSREGAQAQAEASRPLPRPPGMYKDLDTEWRKVMLQTKVNTTEQGGCYKRVLRLFVSPCFTSDFSFLRQPQWLDRHISKWSNDHGQFTDVEHCAFHTFSMEKHYEVLMVEAGSYFHHQSIGYQAAVSHILKGPSRSPNGVNSEDYGQPSIRFPWRNTTRFWWWKQGPTSTIKALGTRELCHTFWRDRVEAQTVSIQKIMDSLPYVFHGETLRGFDGGSRVLLPPSKHWVPGSCVTHFEGTESKPKPCQFRRLWTAFHTFSMEKHYEVLMVEAGSYFHHQSIGYQGAVSHILKGPSRSPNRVNSEDYGQPSIRFPWRNTTRFWWWKQGPTSTIKALGTRELCHTFWRDGVEAHIPSIQPLPRQCLPTNEGWHTWSGSLLQTGLAFVCFTCHFCGKRSDWTTS